MAGLTDEGIRALLHAERYCVLCTQGEGGAYGSLLCYAIEGRSIAFCTPRTTRKYGLLRRCNRVALLVDNRSTTDDLMAIEAITATGEAHEVTDDDARARWASLLVARHPDLRAFASSPSCALFVVELEHCSHVVRFQEVFEWSADDR